MVGQCEHSAFQTTRLLHTLAKTSLPLIEGRLSGQTGSQEWQIPGHSPRYVRGMPQGHGTGYLFCAATRGDAGWRRTVRPGLYAFPSRW